MKRDSHLKQKLLYALLPLAVSPAWNIFQNFTICYHLLCFLDRHISLKITRGSSSPYSNAQFIKMYIHLLLHFVFVTVIIIIIHPVLRPPPIHHLCLIVMLLPHFLKFLFMLFFFPPRFIFGFTRVWVPRRCWGQGTSVLFVGYSLEFGRDIIPLRREGSGTVFGVMFFGGSGMEAGGVWFIVRIVVVMSVRGVRLFNLWCCVFSSTACQCILNSWSSKERRTAQRNPLWMRQCVCACTKKYWSSQRIAKSIKRQRNAQLKGAGIARACEWELEMKNKNRVIALYLTSR